MTSEVLPPTVEGAGQPSQLRWLRIARAGWVVVLLVTILLNVVAVRDTFGSYFSLSPQVLGDLRRHGFSPALYIGLMVIENVPLQLVYLGLGLLLFWRRNDDPIALFCSFVLVTFGNTLGLFAFTTGTIAPSLDSSAVLRELTLILFAMGQISLVVFFYIFPSGRFAPRWTRWFSLVVVAYWLAVAWNPSIPTQQDTTPLPFLADIFWLSAAVAQAYRYRRVSTPRERQQTKWAVYGLVLAGLFLLITVPISVLAVPSSITSDPVIWGLNPVFQIALILIPIFLTIAVWRARLWDIDVIINRTLVYGTLTGVLVALYAALIIGLESLAAVITGAANEPIALVVSTLIIASLIQPLRRRIQRVIDRRFYRQKYDAQKTLEAFSATLRQEIELEQLRSHLLATVQETLQPEQVSLWLNQPRPTALP